MVTRCNTYDKQPLTTYRTPAGILEFLISLVRMSWDSRNRCYQILILQASFFGIIDRGDTDTAETSKTHNEIRSNINIWTNIRVHTKYKIRVARFVMADDSQICSLGRQIRSPAAVWSLCNYAFAPFSAQRAMDYYRRTGPEVTTCDRIIVTIYRYCTAEKMCGWAALYCRCSELLSWNICRPQTHCIVRWSCMFASFLAFILPLPLLHHHHHYPPAPWLLPMQHILFSPSPLATNCPAVDTVLPSSTGSQVTTSR